MPRFVKIKHQLVVEGKAVRSKGKDRCEGKGNGRERIPSNVLMQRHCLARAVTARPTNREYSESRGRGGTTPISKEKGGINSDGDGGEEGGMKIETRSVPRLTALHSLVSICFFPPWVILALRFSHPLLLSSGWRNRGQGHRFFCPLGGPCCGRGLLGLLRSLLW